MSGNSKENSGQGMIVNPKPKADNQDWDGDEADRADRLRFEEEQAMIREQSEARAAAKAAAERKASEAAASEARESEAGAGDTRDDAEAAEAPKGGQ